MDTYQERGYALVREALEHPTKRRIPDGDVMAEYDRATVYQAQARS